ncbi:DoxX family protein [Blastopirellula marina]|uniref:DoxX family protein n=1 Tax=Blastopirellula marina TaxID=124 RepID=A0A2S8F6S4_9BACT|nr:DoxX family protein [Blastopirellula marina]PQO27861.1 DoxX family protein [Blastopirellula marina]PTL41596.1 DoxX family protein [Blastopirellula marina]
MSEARMIQVASWLVRGALAAAFLSAVADRFGVWGAPGSEGIAWGNIENYESYVALLNWFLPSSLVSPVGWIATISEIVIALGLILGWQLRWFALAAGVLLTLFATTMLVAFGPKPPLDYSVFSAASAAYLLFAVTSPGNTANVTSEKEPKEQ